MARLFPFFWRLSMTKLVNFSWVSRNFLKQKWKYKKKVSEGEMPADRVRFFYHRQIQFFRCVGIHWYVIHHCNIYSAHRTGFAYYRGFFIVILLVCCDWVPCAPTTALLPCSLFYFFHLSLWWKDEFTHQWSFPRWCLVIAQAQASSKKRSVFLSATQPL